MHFLLLSAFLVGAPGDDQSVMTRVSLKEFPEVARQAMGKLLPGVSYSAAFRESTGKDVETGAPTFSWHALGTDRNSRRVYIHYGSAMSSWTELKESDLPPAVRDALKTHSITPKAVYEVSSWGADKPFWTNYFVDEAGNTERSVIDGKRVAVGFKATGKRLPGVRPIPAMLLPRPASAPAQPAPPAFEPVRSEQGRFTIEMPGKPQSVVQKYTRPADKAAFEFHHLRTIAGGGEYVLTYVDLPDADVNGKESQKVLQAFLRGGAKGKEIVEERETVLGKHRVLGRHVLARDGDRYIRDEVCLYGNRLYRLMAIGTRGAVTSADANRFFNSFAVIQKDGPFREGGSIVPIGTPVRPAW